MDVAIIGGGISGLAAAWSAVAHGRSCGRELRVCVVEADREVGGKAQSVRQGAYLHELGPLGFMDHEPVMQSLIGELGLEGLVVPAAPEANHRFLVRDRQLVEIPANPLAFARSGILSPRGLARMAAEPFIRRGGGDGESVWQFAARRLGQQFADRLINPMTIGIFAGDAKELSLQAAFPQMAALEKEHGSLIRGAIAQRRGGRKRGTLTSFAGGLQTLPQRLVERGGFEIRTGARIAEVKQSPGGWLLTGEDGAVIEASSVIVAAEAWSAARMLEASVPTLAALLSQIRFPPMAVVALAFAGADAELVPRGFGSLIPREEGLRTLGVTWDSRMFPQRCGDGEVLIRALMGGTWDPGIAELGESALREAAIADMRAIFGFVSEPHHANVKLWPQAIPQYEIGHPAIVRAVDDHLAEMPGLYFAGNSLYGTSFGKSTEAGVRAGRAAAGLAVKA